MRLFIALDLPAAVRDELVRAQTALRGHPVRWVNAASAHLTLQFLGETDDEQVAPLLAGLATIPAHQITLRLAGLGAFPEIRAPRVLWVGVDGDTAALGELRAAVVTATAALGIADEGRAWRPHLTLGRVRQGARPAEARALGEALRREPPPRPVVWQAGTPTLFVSRLAPDGPVYTALGP